MHTPLDDNHYITTHKLSPKPQTGTGCTCYVNLPLHGALPACIVHLPCACEPSLCLPTTSILLPACLCM